MNCDLDELLSQAGVEVSLSRKKVGIRLPDVPQTAPRSYRISTGRCPHALASNALCASDNAASSGTQSCCTPSTILRNARSNLPPESFTVTRSAMRHSNRRGEEVAVSMKRLYGIPQCKVIANCIPTSTYANPGVSRRQWRAQEGFVEDDVLFVCVARFARQKNHALLVKAFAQVCARHPKHSPAPCRRRSLAQRTGTQVNGLGLDGRVRFLGLRADIPKSSPLAMSSFSVLKFEGIRSRPRGHGRGPSNHIYRGRRCSESS